MKCLQFRKKQKYLLKKIFCSLQNCFPNYVYLKYMYITLKEMEKTMFILVFKNFANLLISKFHGSLRWKNETFQSLRTTFCAKQIYFSLMHPTHITIHSFWRRILGNFLNPLYFFLELETREGWIVQRVHLYIWAAAGHELTCANG